MRANGAPISLEDLSSQSFVALYGDALLRQRGHAEYFFNGEEAAALGVQGNLGAAHRAHPTTITTTTAAAALGLTWRLLLPKQHHGHCQQLGVVVWAGQKRD